jgi:hypothetical protein
MLLPQKHIKLAESLLGLGSFVLQSLQRPKHLDGIWKEFQEAYESKVYPAYHSFENLILATDFLFAIDAVKLLPDGKLTLCA